jgi:hypothetical protein
MTTKAVVVDVERVEIDAVLFRNRTGEIRVKFADACAVVSSIPG